MRFATIIFRDAVLGGLTIVTMIALFYVACTLDECLKPTNCNNVAINATKLKLEIRKTNRDKAAW